MTLDWVEGIPLGDNDALDDAGFDRERLGEKVLQSFLTHALQDGYFHADMHQGNLRVGAAGELSSILGLWGISMNIPAAFMPKYYLDLSAVIITVSPRCISRRATFQPHRTSKNLRVHCVLLVNYFWDGCHTNINGTPVKSPV